MPRPEVNLSPEHTALVVVECQGGTVGADSALPELKAAAAPALPGIARLAQAARKAGARVVHLTYVPAFGGLSTNRVTPLQQAIGPLNAGWTAERGGNVVDEIGVEPGDVAHAQHRAVRGAAQRRRADRGARRRLAERRHPVGDGRTGRRGIHCR